MKRSFAVLILSMLVVMAVVLAACGQAGEATPRGSEVDGESYRDITPAQLKEMLDNEDFLLVNVHIPYGGEIPGTDLFVPYDGIEENFSMFPDDKEVNMVVYCRSGPMSSTAASTLVELGFTSVLNLAGGYVEWERQSYELTYSESSTGQPRIYFDEDSVDMGKVPWGDSAPYTFHFKNVGAAPLIIEDVSVLALEGC
ncbi:MAG: rhodanese-like domain-containing protein [Dehalococcoidia bacterium]